MGGGGAWRAREWGGGVWGPWSRAAEAVRVSLMMRCVGPRDCDQTFRTRVGERMFGVGEGAKRCGQVGGDGFHPGLKLTIPGSGPDKRERGGPPR